MPDKKERDLWWAYLEGRPEEEWNITKNSKRQQQRMQGRNQSLGMRAWADEPEQEPTSEVIIYESSLLNDEGEVEEVLKPDPSELLPTPSGTPAPPDVSECSQSTREPVLIPREPSTKVLKQIDEVSRIIFSTYRAFLTLTSAHCAPFTDVLHSLD